jgi:hypothetical protein
MSYGKPSWMTETSGESPAWLASSTTGGFPDQGAFSIAVKLTQALTVGEESAWLYWQLTDGSPSSTSDEQNLTDATQLTNDPKYVAVKHFFKFIRPDSQRVAATVTGSSTLLASAFVNDATQTLTVVLVNEASTSTSVTLTLPATPALDSLSTYTSSNGSYWHSSMVSASDGTATVTVPGYGVVTLVGSSAATDGGFPVIDGGSTTTDAGSPPDAGSRTDAGSPPDGGSAPDAGSEHDAGIVSDAGVEPDAGTTVDAGSQVDAGIAFDAGLAAQVGDAGVSVDAGSTSPVDAGSLWNYAGSSAPAGCGCGGSPYDSATLLFMALGLARLRKRRTAYAVD